MIEDLRYAIRWLRGSPLWTLAAALTLALGIGANSSIFSLVSAVLLRPLPFVDPAQLTVVWGYHPHIGNLGGLVGILDFSPAHIEALIGDGMELAAKHDCEEARCILGS